MMGTVPGFGWAAHLPPPSGSVTLMEGGGRAISEIEHFPGTFPGELVNLFAKQYSQADAAIEDVEEMAKIIAKKMTNYFESKGLEKQLQEVFLTRKSNNRILKWEIMIIKPNSTFKFHAHPNIEFIYVVKGTIHELRLQSLVEKDYNASPEGPDLRSFTDPKAFKSNYVTAEQSSSGSAAVGAGDGAAVGTGTEAGAMGAIEGANRYIVNEIGSCHLSYTLDDGAVLLVLWGGGHSNIPIEHYPPVPLPVAVEGRPLASA
jgi:hypothetical protein